MSLIDPCSNAIRVTKNKCRERLEKILDLNKKENKQILLDYIQDEIEEEKNKKPWE